MAMVTKPKKKKLATNKIKHCWVIQITPVFTEATLSTGWGELAYNYPYQAKVGHTQ